LLLINISFELEKNIGAHYRTICQTNIAKMTGSAGFIQLSVKNGRLFSAKNKHEL
jgi:hypothetical protein